MSQFAYYAIRINIFKLDCIVLRNIRRYCVLFDKMRIYVQDGKFYISHPPTICRRIMHRQALSIYKVVGEGSKLPSSMRVASRYGSEI